MVKLEKVLKLGELHHFNSVFYILLMIFWLLRLDIMEYTSQHLEAGYMKIFKWCAFESRGFSKDTLEVSHSMRVAIARLKARPELLELVFPPLIIF